MRIHRLILLVAIHGIVSAQTILKGNIGGLMLEEPGNPYIVEKDVTIPKGTETVIKPGVVILFHAFSTLIVEGNFLVEGIREQPVVFTSVNNPDYNRKAGQTPQAFDWNGIEIRESADTVKMKDFLLSYTVFGIKSKRDDIVLLDGVFTQNGQFNLTIKEKIILVKDMLPYSFNAQAEKTAANPPPVMKDTGSGTTPYTPRRILSPRQSNIRTASHITLGVAAVEAVATGGLFGGYVYYQGKYDNATGKEFGEYDKKRRFYANAGIVAAVGTGVTAAVWGVLYSMYKHDPGKAPVAVISIPIPEPYHASSLPCKIVLCVAF